MADPVPAQPLGLVHQPVSLGDERFQFQVMGAPIGDAKAGGDARGFALADHRHGSDGNTQPIGQHDRFGQGGFRQQDNEFLAAPTSDDVRIAQSFFQDAGSCLEYLVTAGVSIGVVDALEVVEVEHDHAQVAAVPVRDAPDGLADAVERAPVVGVGEWVEPGQVLGLLTS